MAILAECRGLTRRGLRYRMILISSSLIDTAVYKLHLRASINSHVGPSQLEILLQRERNWEWDRQIAAQVEVIE
eukprot:127602-Rhodomonas_salina.2